MSAIRIARLLVAVAVCASGAMASAGSSLPPVKGKVVLSVSGSIDKTNKDKSAQFDMPGLESLGTVKFSTTTPWFKGKVEFEGVPVAKIIELVGAKGTTMVLTALNDYSVPVPLADAVRHGAIIAIKRDGKPMPVSDKGPLWLVYNYDSDKELQQKKYYSGSAWQLAKIEVK